MLIEKCELQGVVSMPSGIFKPYAGVSTAVLIFVKGGETKNVWFYDMKADGFTLDDKRTKTSDNDIPDIIKKWNERNLETDTNRKSKAFFVPRKEIEAGGYDLSINKYKETEYEEVTYEDPKIILEKIENLEHEISSGTAVLKNMDL